MRLNSDICAKCKHSGLPAEAADETLRRCYHPTIIKTFTTGMLCKEARGPGRWCGPAGDFYAPE